MFHVKHLLNRLKNTPIHELIFYLLLLTIPIQLRTIVSPETAYIDYAFSYHKAFFFYLSDIFFITWFIAVCFKRKFPKLALWAFLPIIWAVFQLFHVEHTGLALYQIFKIVEFWLILAIISQNQTMSWPIPYFIAALGLFQAALAINQYFVQDALNLEFLGEYIPPQNDPGRATIETGTSKVLRAYGTMPHPNVLGGFLTISLTFFLFVSRETIFKGKKLIFYACGTFLLVWGLVVSFSRSAWLAAAFLVVVFALHQTYKKGLSKALFWVITLIVSCGTLVVFHADTVFPRANDLFNQSNAISYRSLFNNWAIELIKENKALGLGPGQYIPTIEKRFHVEPWAYQPPHNVFLMYTAEYGFIGLSLALFTLYKLGFTWNILKNPFFYLFGVPTLVLMLSDHYLLTIQQGLLLFAIIIGFIISNIKDVSQTVKHL